MAVQPGLCGTWSETPKTGFLTTRLIVVWHFNDIINMLYKKTQSTTNVHVQNNARREQCVVCLLLFLCYLCFSLTGPDFIAKLSEIKLLSVTVKSLNF